MAKYVGLDWAGKGWFGVVLEDGAKSETELFPTILSVWHKHDDAERIFIDIPIGLPENGRRECDEVAAEKLGPGRRSSVFWTPCRDAVYATTLEEAKEINRKNTDYSISNQTWAIMPRIREVDEFLQEFEKARDTVREVHPEVCFRAFDGAAMANGKKTDDGLQKRREVLSTVDERADDIYEEAVEKQIDGPEPYARTLPKDARDDVIDALAAALTAQANENRLTTFPAKLDEDDFDETGLPMEMVYRTELD
jgi:predicted RNase H-like nuclease